MADTLETLEIEVKHSASGAADEITKVTEAIRGLSSALNRVPKKIRELAAAMEVLKGKSPNISFNDNHTTQIADTINNVKQATNGAKKGLVEAAKGVKELSKSAVKSKSPLDNFVSSLKRIAFYRIIRSIIKSITQAFQEGLQNAYTFSQGITTEGHRFAEAMDSMKTAGTTMKNQLGSAFIALLTAIAPIVNAIIGLITKLANALSQLFAVFTGGTYLKAVDMPQKWGEAAGGAAKAAKEWKNQLLGFDEINRLEEPSDPSGGGGGGGGGGMGAYEDTPIDGIFKRMRDKLLELKNSLDFTPLLESWERLKESIKALADTILSGLAWAWENILVPLAHWTIEELAPTLVNLLAAAFDLLRAVLEALAPILEALWNAILRPMIEFIGDVVITVLESLTGLLSDLARLISGEISFKEFINGLSDMEVIIGGVCLALGGAGLIGLVEKLAFSSLVALFTAIGKINTALAFLAANPAVAAVAAIAAIITVCVLLYKHWDELKQKLAELSASFTSTLGDGKLQWSDFAAIGIGAIQALMMVIEHLVHYLQVLVGWIVSAVNAWNSAGATIGQMSAMSQSADFGFGTFAEGGYPTEGELFFARENGAGAELVGTIGGRTAVASNDDILNGIRQGVFEAVSAAMSNSGTSFPVVRVYLDSREIKNGQNRLNRAMGVG